MDIRFIYNGYAKNKLGKTANGGYSYTCLLQNPPKELELAHYLQGRGFFFARRALYEFVISVMLKIKWASELVVAIVLPVSSKTSKDLDLTHYRQVVGFFLPKAKVNCNKLVVLILIWLTIALLY